MDKKKEEKKISRKIKKGEKEEIFISRNVRRKKLLYILYFLAERLSNSFFLLSEMECRKKKFNYSRELIKLSNEKNISFTTILQLMTFAVGNFFSLILKNFKIVFCCKLNSVEKMQCCNSLK